MDTNIKKDCPLENAEYFAKPIWHNIDISKTSGNLCLSVLWGVCNEDGSSVPVPEGFDRFEAAKGSYVLAFADDKRIDDTRKSHARLREWCPDFDGNPFWFDESSEEFYKCVVRITVEHDTWEGATQCKAKWTNPKERTAKERVSTVDRDAVMKKFAKQFKAIGVKVGKPSASKKAENPPSAASVQTAHKSEPTTASAPPAPSSAPSAQRKSTKAECWASFSRLGGKTPDWYNLIAEVGEKVGKAEGDFTPEDWGEVMNGIERPF